MTGGLGATPDDVTRRVMASVLGRKLIFRESLLEGLRAKVEARGRTMTPAAESMALVPNGAQPLENGVGIAPGLMLRTEHSLLFALPGVPAEMERMLNDEVLKHLKREELAGREISRTLRTAGVSETTLADIVGPLLADGVTCAYLPAAGRVDLCLSASGGKRAEQGLAESLSRIQEQLGPAIYATGDRTLGATVLRLLEERKLTLGVAESLTGGQIGAALTRVPGSSAVFLGDVVAYSNEAKEKLLGVMPTTLRHHGAVSGPVAAEMAAGACRAFGSDVAVSTTGIAGPDGGTEEKPVGLVHFGLCGGRFCRSLRYRFGGDRRMIQAASVTVALNMLRVLLIDRLDLLWDGERPGTGRRMGS